MEQYIEVNGRRIGPGQPTYIIAEMSGNHNQNFEDAVKILHSARDAGADAIKLQTYTPDTMTIDCDNEHFQLGEGTIWAGRNLYELYGEAHTPWEWQPKLQTIAHEIGLDFLSTAYDSTAVDFLESLDVPVFKIASFENIDLPLLRKIARTGKPIIMSTGMATLADIEEGVRTIEEAGGTQLALLKCTSAYPAAPEEMNLRSIPHLAETYPLPIGLSDHTLSTSVPIAAVALGACIVEKHVTNSRSEPGPDSAFSLEPDEFKVMVDGIRTTEQALGRISYGVNEREAHSLVFRRSLFVVKEVKRGERFTEDNVRSIRPGYGMRTRYLEEVLGRSATKDIGRGTPLSWGLVGGVPQ